MRRKYYLVDTENVGDKWFGLLDKIHKNDRIVIFYTENHSKRLREFLLRQVNNSQIIWLECAVGNNALDYQLVGVLGYLIVKHPKASFCIYSNDKGYEKTVEFWESRGIRIKLKGSGQKKKEKKPEKKQDKKNGKKKDKQQAEPSSNPSCQPAAAPVNVNKQPHYASSGIQPGQNGKPSAEQYVMEISKSVPITNMSGWYCALTVVLGQSAGKSWYNKIKENEQMKKELSDNCIADSYRRGVNLTALVLRANGLNAEKGEEAFKILLSHTPKELAEIKAGLDHMIGQPPQNKNLYYNALKPVVSLVHKL